MVDFESIFSKISELIGTLIDLSFTPISLTIGWLPYVLAVFMLYKLGQHVMTYANSLWVEGKPNEWVVIMKNGEFKQAGIGLSCFIGPFDQVAIFPSKLIKVEINTQQVTKEMQGIEVCSMIEWTVDREGEGPMKAYKNLDIDKQNPTKANETLRAMTSAIVRNQIANSTIDEILKNRQGLREAVTKEITEVVAGWGVHLATVEVTDVRICSSGLFSDMQTQFREQNTKKATLEKLVVETDIREERMGHQLEEHKRNWDTSLVQTNAENTQALKKARADIVNFQKTCEIAKKQTQRENALTLQKKEIWVQSTEKRIEIELEEKKAQIVNAIKKEEAARELQVQNDDEQLVAQQNSIKVAAVKAETERKLKQNNYDVLKESFKNPVQVKLQEMQVLGDLHKSMYFSSMRLHQMGDQEPVAEILEKFTRLAEMDTAAKAPAGKK